MDASSCIDSIVCQYSAASASRSCLHFLFHVYKFLDGRYRPPFAAGDYEEHDVTTKTRPRGSRPPTGRPRGRPPTENPKQDYQVMLDPGVADQLRAHGDGNLSAAIESAAEAARHTSKEDVGT